MSNYLQMMHEQLKTIKMFLECWSGYFLSIIFEITTNILYHGDNEYYKTNVR